MKHDPNRGEYLFRLLASKPIFGTLDFVRINDDESLLYKQGEREIRVKMSRCEGNKWAYDAWMNEDGVETVSQRSFFLDELIAFVEDAYSFVDVPRKDILRPFAE